MLYRLSELKSGAKGVISKFEESESKISLMEMGCVPGEMVEIANIAPLGDPMAIQVAGYSLSLRKKEARSIWIELIVETLVGEES